MSATRDLRKVNEGLRELLAADVPATITAPHAADELMVWVLLGGKDVGKSTLLNSLLGEVVTDRAPESAEGTSRLVAYVHEAHRDHLATRLAGLDVDVRYHVHSHDARRRLCLIDSPDFDSSFARHATQVREVLSHGVADGAVLLASPSKYKDKVFWKAFGQLSGAVSSEHILFALTKADELGDFEKAVRDDFTATVARRMATWRRNGDDQPSAAKPRVFLLDSPHKALDFGDLEARLMRRMSVDEVRGAQAANRRRADTHGAREIVRHYRLDELHERATRAADPTEIEAVFEHHFPDAFFHAAADRLRNRGEVTDAVRDHLGRHRQSGLAGLAALLSLGRWLGSLAPRWLQRSNQDAPLGSLDLDICRDLRWGQDDIEDRLAQAQDELIGRLRLPEPEVPSVAPGSTDVAAEINRLFAGHLSRPAPPLFSWPLRLLLNLPVYLYLVFFITILLFPGFLLLEAWDLWQAPALGDVLTPDNVKVSVIGFVGYYVMALLFTVRRRREQAQRVTANIVSDFIVTSHELLLSETARPLSDFRARLAELTESLDTR